MRTPLLLGSLLLVVASACAHAPPDSVGTERERLEARQNEFLAATGARDAERTAALFAEDAVLHVANRPPIQGRDAIRQFYGNVYGFLSATSAVPATTRLAAAGDMAYGLGSTTNEFRGPQGAVSHSGKYLLVWRRDAGEWVIAVYSISSDQPS